VILGLLAVAFYTLLERKILRLTQLRLGPNKTTLEGVIQPLADGIKLLTKDNLKPGYIRLGLFFLAPMILFFVFVIV
jgi:NADH-quinone oxidoreductase subunit H